MKTADVVRKVRLYLRDVTKTSLSNWEIFEGINDALALIADLDASIKGDLFRRSTTLMFEEDMAALPDDFIKVDRVFSFAGNELLRVFESEPGEGEYSIAGVYMLSGESAANLSYFGKHRIVSSWTEDSSVVSLEDPNATISLPDKFLVPLARIAAAAVRGDISTMERLAAAYMKGKLSIESETGEKESSSSDE